MGDLPKNASDFIPFCKDQGIPNLVGTANKGVSLQGATHAMPADGVITFAALGLGDMEDGSYQIVIQNHSDAADEGTVDPATRTSAGFTIVGPDTADVLDILILGRLAGQLA